MRETNKIISRDERPEFKEFLKAETYSKVYDLFGNEVLVTAADSALESFVIVKRDKKEVGADVYQELEEKNSDILKLYSDNRWTLYNLLSRRVEPECRFYGIELLRYANNPKLDHRLYNCGAYTSIYCSRGNLEKLRPKIFTLITIHELLYSKDQIKTINYKRLVDTCLHSRISLIDLILIKNGTEAFKEVLKTKEVEDYQLGRLVNNTSINDLTDIQMEAITSLEAVFYEAACDDSLCNRQRTLVKLATMLS